MATPMTRDTLKSLVALAIIIVAVLMVGGCTEGSLGNALANRFVPYYALYKSRGMCNDGHQEACVRHAALYNRVSARMDQSTYTITRPSRPAFQQHYHAPPCVNCRWAGPGHGPAHPY